MNKKQTKEFIEWLLIDCVGIGTGLKAYIKQEEDKQKAIIAHNIYLILDY